jgi:hypothetical protein
MKKILIIAGVVVLAGLLSAGSFFGGRAYERTQASRVRSDFLRSRGIPLNGTGDGAQGFNGAPGASGGQRQFFLGGGDGGVSGQVKSIDGNVLTLSTPQDVTTVNISDTTRIEKTVAGTTGDLQPGQRVIVSGERDSKGNLSAAQITIIPDIQFNNETAP